MKNRPQIQDAIDRRDFKRDLASRVIKRSRVHFIPKEEENQEEEEILERILAENESLGETSSDEPNEDGLLGLENGLFESEDEPDLDMSGVSEDALKKADDILARLQREAEEDEEIRRQEWLKKIANGEV